MMRWMRAAAAAGFVACCLGLTSCGDGSAGLRVGQAKGLAPSALACEKAAYGKLPDGREADLYTLTNSRGMRVRLTNYGAITVSVEVPDRDGKLADVTLGFDAFDDWLGNASHFGATIGRYANRIANGRFTLDGKEYVLATNNGPNHIHGGVVGFDKVLWQGQPVRRPGAIGVQFTYLSKDGEEGYPGNLNVTAVYTLSERNEYKAEFTATTDKPTIVNLANHTYWNLTGDPSGDVLGHVVMLTADRYTPVDEGLIPTGELAPVAGTPMDFTKPMTIGSRIAQVPGGYDHNYVLRNQGGQVALAARVEEPTTGRVMEIWTDQPGVQFYTGNFLNGAKGKGGVAYNRHAGFCLETQHYPDSPNRPQFPSVVLRPGQTYRHVMVHRFLVK